MQPCPRSLSIASGRYSDSSSESPVSVSSNGGASNTQPIRSVRLNTSWHNQHSYDTDAEIVGRKFGCVTAAFPSSFRVCNCSCNRCIFWCETAAFCALSCWQNCCIFFGMLLVKLPLLVAAAGCSCCIRLSVVIVAFSPIAAAFSNRGTID